MSIRSNGSYIGPRPAGPSVSVASGIWDLRTAERQRRAAAWPSAGSDPLFSQVTLLLHMNGSNGSTTFTDSSGSPKTITAYGNAQISTAQSKFGGAAGLFDGSGDYLGLSSHPTIGTQEFTIEFWLYPLTVSGLQIYVDFRPDNGAYPLLYSSGSTLYYYVDSQNVITGSISSSQWQHIAVSRSGSSTRLFVDGTQAGSTYTDTVNYAASVPAIGKSFDDYFFNAYMDELRITVGSGAGRYTANFTPPTAAFPDE